MTNTQGQITFGEQLKKSEAGGFIITETLHPASLVLPRHDHECANINLTIKGSFREIIGSRPQECGPSSLLIKPAGEAHANIYGSAGARCLIIEVMPQRLETIRPLSTLFERPDHFKSRFLAGLGMRIYTELQAVGGASPLMLEGLILELLALATQDNMKGSANPPRWLVAVRDLIHEQFTEPLSLASVAAAIGIHPTQLARMFRKHYHCTIGEYVRRRRLDYAIRELLCSDKTLSEIALAAGFYDQSHFTHAFKLQFRMTPSDFRATAKASNVNTNRLRFYNHS